MSNAQVLHCLSATYLLLTYLDIKMQNLAHFTTARNVLLANASGGVAPVVFGPRELYLHEVSAYIQVDLGRLEGNASDRQHRPACNCSVVIGRSKCMNRIDRMHRRSDRPDRQTSYFEPDTSNNAQLSICSAPTILVIMD